MRNIPFVPTVLSLALAAAFTPAYAQEDPIKNNEEILATSTEEKIASEEEKVEVIEIRGVRASMAKAQDIKMESDSILDSIVAEDIGKLPDLTAAESIARIAGVQVSRSNDEANAILIRGLPDVTTTYNGREFFTAEWRRAALQDFPSQALAGIEVYKSTTADLVEPGLAGLVNIRTRRPFDFDGEKIAGGIHYGYNDQSEEASPSANILYSNRWQTSIGEFGFLGNATYAESKYHNGVRWNSTNNAQALTYWDTEEPYTDSLFLMPAVVGLYNASGKRWRPSANIAIQWRPNEDLEIYFDGIYQGYRGETNADNFSVLTAEWDWLNGANNGHYDITLENIEMVEGSNNTQVASATKSWGIPAQAFRSTNYAETNTYQFAIGAKWTTDRVHFETDFAYTNSKYKNDEWSFDTGLSFSPTWNIDFLGDGGVLFETTDWDPMDASTYEVRGYWESLYKTSGEGFQWRADFEIDTNLGDWLHTVKTGVRISDRDAAKEQGNRYAWMWDLHIPVTDLDYLNLEATHNPYRTNEQGFTQYLAPSRNSITGNEELLQAFAYEKAVERGDPVASQWNVPLVGSPANDWLAEETTYAAYVQTTSRFEVGNVEIDVYAGVRIAQTESTSMGVSTVTDENGVQTNTPRTAENSYTDVLPNISFRAKLTEKLHLRAGFTQTVTKPDFAALNPALNITQTQATTGISVNPNVPEEELVSYAYGSSGNPDLKSLTSDNYDISLEYYFSKTGNISAAAFYRDLWGFTNIYSRYVETEEYGTVILTRPENAGEGHIKGWELNGYTFFDFDFMPVAFHNLGISANVTHLEGENRVPEADGSFGGFAVIPGLSEYTVNSSIFYEKDGFSTRLSMNMRDEWVNWYGEGPDEGNFYGNKTKARIRLDFNMSYDVNEHLAIYFDIANILAKPYQNYTVNSVDLDGEGTEYQAMSYRYPQDIRDEGRYFGGGFRFSF